MQASNNNKLQSAATAPRSDDRQRHAIGHVARGPAVTDSGTPSTGPLAGGATTERNNAMKQKQRAVVCAFGATMLAMAAVISAQAEQPEPEPVRITVTGQTMAVNGYDQVPRGLFGVHWTDLDPQMIQEWGIELARQMHPTPDGHVTVPDEREDWRGLAMVMDCLGDRYHPATVLTNPDWEGFFTELGTRYGNEAKEAGVPVIAEFWNETFLNWSYKPGVNYDPQFYEQEGREVGAPMTIKGWDEPLEHLVWNRAIRTVHVDGRSDLMSYLAYNYIGRFHLAGHEFEFRGHRFRNQEMWWGTDPTQVSYWSGRQNAQFYRWMLVPFAQALKEANPEVEVIAGPSYSPSAGGWEAWEILYKPVIDEAWQWIDGLTEHHYHGDSRRAAVQYEVITSYAMTRYGKFLRGYNTEAGGRADANLPGAPETEQGDPLRTAIGAFNYGLRDIVYMLHTQPDKAASRTTHGANKEGWGLGGDEFFFRLLRPLRGRLILTRSSDRDVWSVASVNDAGDLVVVVYNDHREPRKVRVDALPPRGTSLAGEGTRAWVEVDAEEHRLVLVEEPLRLEADRDAAPGVTLELAARSGQRLVLPLTREVPEGVRVERTQAFGPDVLIRVNPDEMGIVDIELDAARLAAAERASLRLALQPHNSEALWRVEGVTEFAPLPNTQGIVEIPLDPAALDETVRVTFHSGREKPDGLLIPAVSIMLDTPTE